MKIQEVWNKTYHIGFLKIICTFCTSLKSDFRRSIMSLARHTSDNNVKFRVMEVQYRGGGESILLLRRVRVEQRIDTKINCLLYDSTVQLFGGRVDGSFYCDASMLEGLCQKHVLKSSPGLLISWWHKSDPINANPSATYYLVSTVWKKCNIYSCLSYFETY